MPPPLRSALLGALVLLLVPSAAGADVVTANNPFLLFDDTSSAPNALNDWRLQANDPDPGTDGFFALDDVTGATTPWKITAGAPTNAFLMNNGGDVGLGTGVPSFDLQITRTDTPGVRLEQTNGGGFTAQTWDVAGNEANFFVRDLTGGSRLPFRIRPGAPTSSIDVAASGNVGIDTDSPQATMHVRRTNGTAQLRVEEASAGAAAQRVLADLVNKGAPQLRFSNTDAGATSWLAGPGGSTAFVLKATGGSAVDALSVDPGGQTTAAGALQQVADPAALEETSEVQAADILAAIRSLPISRFEFKSDASNAKHLAPGAAQFRAALGVGAGDTAIAPGDVAAAALAGVQALASGTSAAAVSTRVDGLATTVDGLTTKSGQLYGALISLGTRVGKLEKSNRTLRKRTGRLGKRVSALSKRLRALEEPASKPG